MPLNSCFLFAGLSPSQIERIAAITEQMALRDGRINEERRIQKQHSPRYANDPRIKALKERIAAELATVESVRSNYLAQSNATQAARAAR